MTSTFSWGLVLLLALASQEAAAESIFGGGSALDPSFCKQRTIRQTVVYVDDSILVENQTGWTRTMYDKLKATLTPGERVTLVELSPNSGSSAEIWSGCWPAYTADEQAKMAQETHLFSSSPLEALKDQQNFFTRDFGIAAEKIQVKGQRASASVAVDVANPPSKSVLRALASDGARYAQNDFTIRVILYSDLLENSDLGSVFKPEATPAPDYGAKLGSYLRRSVFYVFGVGSTLAAGGAVQDDTKSFWNDAFRSMAVNIGGVGADLNIPNVIPVSSASYTLALSENGQSLVGHLALLVDADGSLVDSWLGITRLRNASINGTFHCSGAGGSPPCTLMAQTSGGVISMSPTETVQLTSKGSASLDGTIGVEGSSVNLALRAVPVGN